LAARRTGQYALSAVAGTAIILLLHARVYLDYTSDDAYISFRYARNLGDGLGLVWNPGEHVEGYSNFLWVMILAGAYRLGADIVVSGRWLGFVFAVAAGLGTYALSRDLLMARRARRASPPRCCSPRPGHGRCGHGGLENSSGILVLAGVTASGSQDGASLPASGVVWAAVAMTCRQPRVLRRVRALQSGQASCACVACHWRARPSVAAGSRASPPSLCRTSPALLTYGWLFRHVLRQGGLELSTSAASAT
jgi:hypothetical protein